MKWLSSPARPWRRGCLTAAKDTGADPKALAEAIGFALLTTALGLTVAIPLVLAGNMIHVRMGKLQDSVQEDLGGVLDDLNTVSAGSGESTT